ncbi:globin [Virgibacillus sp. 179-BFC.A HS]|uniref:Globin n=1 Tax=Tigheibacillus jepli TaxID=3035914 RepID=A0ABU5CK24_9BACI|nr:globin [Virgibacillus sp. 179-BFC.A HS]MDY0406169.1 globin [Virgibacillus sp. 179-BFC.A HS]
MEEAYESSKRPGTMYEAIGGAEAIDKIVNGLYKRIGSHPDLIPIFPEDLTETAKKQRYFLTQFFGGPKLYNAYRGQPMLRRRHLPFEITPTRKDAWLSCLAGALEEADIAEPYRSAIFEKLTMTAHHMMNTPE